MDNKFRTFLDEELNQVTENIIRDSFEKGIPISYMENGKVIREYPDGTKKEMMWNKDSNDLIEIDLETDDTE